MSADAKIWFDKGEWHGLHDGDCTITSCTDHKNFSSYGLVELLQEIELCANNATPIRWEFRTYSDGEVGLVGYCY